MIEDRDYMREEQWQGPSFRFGWSATNVLMVLCVLAFVAQHFFTDKLTNDYLALTAEGLFHGYVWQLITFQFLHAGIVHLAFNLFGLWMCGRFVEARLGLRRFLFLYLGSGAVGGLLQVLLALIYHAGFGGPVFGASAGICGLLAAYCIIDPDAQFYLYFLIPIRSRHLLILLVLGTLAFTLAPFVKLALHIADTSPSNVANAAHLGGMLAGMAFIYWGGTSFRRPTNWHPFQSGQRKRDLVRTASGRGRSWGRPADEAAEEPRPEEFISKEVDPILEKISAHGIHSLTDRERKILEAARKKMSGR